MLGSEEQKHKYLPSLARFDAIGCWVQLCAYIPHENFCIFFFILPYISISYIERVLQNGGECVLMAVLCQLIELMVSIDHFELFPV